MSALPAEMQDHLRAIPEGLWSIFLPQLRQLEAQTLSVPYGLAAHLDGVIATGWFWAGALGDDCLITTMHLAVRRSFVLVEQPEVDYLVLGLLSSVDTSLVNDMRETPDATSEPAGSFACGFSPTLERNALAFPMERGPRQFEMPAGSLHDSCNICMLPSFVDRMQAMLGPEAPSMAKALSEGLELNGSEAVRATMRAIDPAAATRAGAALHYRALVLEALAETASFLKESEVQRKQLDLHRPQQVAGRVSAALRASLAKPPSLDELADRLFMGKTHLCQAFREETGLSIGQHLARLRVDEAKRRLGRGTESVAEIARAVGYAHTSSFSTMFLRETGMSPTAWRTTHTAH